jgi:TetR/AcrR family transcriptional regulator, transcriptional repressor for nem operon
MAGRPRSFEPEEALDRAMTVFWRKGYERTGLLDLEESTGLGRQSLYNVFGDKRVLFTQVIEHYFEKVLRPGVIDVLDAPGSGRENLERVFRELGGCGHRAGVQWLSGRQRRVRTNAADDLMVDLLRRKIELVEAAFRRALARARAAPSFDACSWGPAWARWRRRSSHGEDHEARER